MPTGSIIIVGTGIKAGGHLTLEAQSVIERADVLLFLVADPVTRTMLLDANSSAVSLHTCYADGKQRKQSYEEMVEKVLAPAAEGKFVCLALYGHPGVFVFPSHEIVRRARARGITAVMQPGISAEDCLFADAGFDPAASGCQSFEATDFLIYDRIFDRRCALILWQIGLVGETDFRSNGYGNRGLDLLLKRLEDFYPSDHKVLIYEAAQYAVCEPRLDWTTLDELPNQRLTPISTLYLPPATKSESNQSIVEELRRRAMNVTK